MSAPLYIVLFLDGLLSLSFEIVSIRLFTPFFGAGIQQTSVIIGATLVSLALGNYFSNGARPPKAVLRRNAFLLFCLTAVMVSHPSLHYLHGTLSFFKNSLLKQLLLSAVVIGPIGFLYGQILPAIFELNGRKAPGHILAVATGGSFLGAVGSSLMLTYLLNVSQFIFLMLALLGLVVLLVGVEKKGWILLPAIACSVFLNLELTNQLVSSETGVATYKVEKKGELKGLAVNGARYSSVIINGDESAAYNEFIHKNVLNIKEKKKVLVLGAGGFTASLKNKHHAYTYIDVDPRLKEVVQKIFNKNIEGKFIAGDARSFLLQNNEIYDVIIMDLFDHNSLNVPLHMVTIESFKKVKETLSSDGIFAINLVSRGTIGKDERVNRVVKTLNESFGDSCYIVPLLERGLIKNPYWVRNLLGVCPKSSKKVDLIRDNDY